MFSIEGGDKRYGWCQPQPKPHPYPALLFDRQRQIDLPRPAAICERAQVKLTAYERANPEDISTACRAALGDERFASAWAEGRSLTLELAVNLALERVS